MILPYYPSRQHQATKQNLRILLSGPATTRSPKGLQVVDTGLLVLAHRVLKSQLFRRLFNRSICKRFVSLQQRNDKTDYCSYSDQRR